MSEPPEDVTMVARVLREMGCRFFVTRHGSGGSKGPYATYDEALAEWLPLAAAGESVSVSATRMLRIAMDGVEKRIER